MLPFSTRKSYRRVHYFFTFGVFGERVWHRTFVRINRQRNHVGRRLANGWLVVYVKGEKSHDQLLKSKNLKHNSARVIVGLV